MTLVDLSHATYDASEEECEYELFWMERNLEKMVSCLAAAVTVVLQGSTQFHLCSASGLLRCRDQHMFGVSTARRLLYYFYNYYAHRVLLVANYLVRRGVADVGIWKAIGPVCGLG